LGCTVDMVVTQALPDDSHGACNLRPKGKPPPSVVKLQRGVRRSSGMYVAPIFDAFLRRRKRQTGRNEGIKYSLFSKTNTRKTTQTL
jgi:hypothetical protein